MALEDPIIAVLGEGGLLARANPHYEYRAQQIEMARRVRTALEERCHALIEAGTGTGKTLAWLLPAVLSGRRVVVSTATRTLQEQVVEKDIPALRAALALDFSVTVMKGRANYLCLSRFERALDANGPPGVLLERDAWNRIKGWAAKTQVGDRAELELPENHPFWRELTATSHTCAGARCPLREQCFVTRMRARATESDLVVVNHHLLFADLALRSSEAGGAVLPPYEAVIFDEAHAIEDVATEFFGFDASDFRVGELLADAEQALAPHEALLSRIGALSDELFTELRSMLPAGAERSLRVGPADLARARLPSGELATALRGLKALIDGLEKDEPEDWPEIQAVGRRAATLADELELLTRAEAPGFVFWIEGRERAARLRAAPIDIAKELQRHLFSLADTVIFTSATLATEGTLDHAMRWLGLAESRFEEGAPSSGEVRARYRVERAVLDSPFDYRTQALLYTPTTLPEPLDPTFTHEAAQEIEALCAITGGRAFVLFTSLRNMREVWQRLRARLPYRVLLQGERPKGALVAAFREEPSVLFASQSFWEGVDIAGEALSLVIIDKLPFASPGDPVVSARIELLRQRGAEPFASYQVPQAALSLRQGFGRLIRTQRDRGIMALLDRRIVTKGYGKRLLASLPPCPRTGERAELVRWWASPRASP